MDADSYDTPCSEPVLKSPGGKLRVLYVFAGKAREKGFEGCLRHCAAGRGLEVEAYDITRDPKHDLVRPKLRKKLLQDVRGKKFFFLAASPPCETFSRAKMSGRAGPPPLRSGACLRGFPGLRGHSRKKVREANLFVDFVLGLAEAQEKVNGMGLLEHPEDLGQAPRGDPGSLWRWPRVRRLASGSWGGLGLFFSPVGAALSQNRPGWSSTCQG